MYISMVSNITHNKLSPNPHLAISGMVTRLLPKITAFVPVPDGNMKENEHANVAGTMSKIGLILPATAMAASTGRKMFAVAVLLLISVINIINVITIIKIISIGYALIKLICEPKYSARPVWLNESAMA